MKIVRTAQNLDYLLQLGVPQQNAQAILDFIHQQPKEQRKYILPKIKANPTISIDQLQPNIDPVVQWAMKIAPKYRNWLVQMVRTNQARMGEDDRKLKTLLTFYHSLSNEEKVAFPIERQTPATLHQEMAKRSGEKDSQYFIPHDKYDKIIYDKDGLQIIWLGDVDNVVAAAKGTNWCVQDPDTAREYLPLSLKEQDEQSDYDDEERGYFHLVVKDGIKTALIHSGTGQAKNPDDSSVRDYSLIKEIWPALSQSMLNPTSEILGMKRIFERGGKLNQAFSEEIKHNPSTMPRGLKVVETTTFEQPPIQREYLYTIGDYAQYLDFNLMPKNLLPQLGQYLKEQVERRWKEVVGSQPLTNLPPNLGIEDYPDWILKLPPLYPYLLQIFQEAIESAYQPTSVFNNLPRLFKTNQQLHQGMIQKVIEVLNHTNNLFAQSTMIYSLGESILKYPEALQSAVNCITRYLEKIIPDPMNHNVTINTMLHGWETVFKSSQCLQAVARQIQPYWNNPKWKSDNKWWIHDAAWMTKAYGVDTIRRLMAKASESLQNRVTASNQDTLYYHGTSNDYNPIDVNTGQRMFGIHLTTDPKAAESYGDVRPYKILPSAKFLNLSDGYDLWSWMIKNEILDQDDQQNIDLENYVTGGRLFQYDFSSRTHYQDDIARTAQSLGFDVVILPDDLGSYEDNNAYVVVNPSVLQHVQPEPENQQQKTASKVVDTLWKPNNRPLVEFPLSSLRGAYGFWLSDDGNVFLRVNEQGEHDHKAVDILEDIDPGYNPGIKDEDGDNDNEEALLEHGWVRGLWNNTNQSFYVNTCSGLINLSQKTALENLGIATNASILMEGKKWGDSDLVVFKNPNSAIKEDTAFRIPETKQILPPVHQEYTETNPYGEVRATWNHWYGIAKFAETSLEFHLPIFPETAQSFQKQKPKEIYNLIFTDSAGGSAWITVYHNLPSIVRIHAAPPNTSTQEEELFKRRGFFKSVVQALQQLGFQSFKVTLQSQDSQKALARMFDKGLISNPSNFTGGSLSTHPTTFDIGQRPANAPQSPYDAQSLQHWEEYKKTHLLPSNRLTDAPVLH